MNTKQTREDIFYVYYLLTLVKKTETLHFDEVSNMALKITYLQAT